MMRRKNLVVDIDPDYPIGAVFANFKYQPLDNFPN